MFGLIRVKTVCKSYQQMTRDLKYERYNLMDLCFFSWGRVGGEN